MESEIDAQDKQFAEIFHLIEMIYFFYLWRQNLAKGYFFIEYKTLPSSSVKHFSGYSLYG